MVWEMQAMGHRRHPSCARAWGPASGPRWPVACLCWTRPSRSWAP